MDITKLERQMLCSNMDMDDSISLKKAQSCRNVFCDGLFQLCEKSIKEEIVAYFEDMTVCRILKQYGQLERSLSNTEPDGNDFSKNKPLYESCSLSRKRSRSHKMLSELCAMLPFDSSVSDDAFVVGSGYTYPYMVRCDSAATRIVDAMQCTVLSKQIAVLAETVLSVEVKCTGGMDRQANFSCTKNVVQTTEKRKTKSITKSGRRGSEKAKGQLKGASERNGMQSLCESGSHFFSIPLFSTHLVDDLPAKLSIPASKSKNKKSKKKVKDEDVPRALTSGRRACSFSIQSVLIPGKPLQLECYTHHMIHFGLLCYSVWNATDSFFVRKSVKKSMTPSQDGIPHGSLTDLSLLLKEELLFPNKPTDGILILGLGGNVIGTCLDACLHSSVHIDIVEIEPAMLNICVRNGLTPPLTSSLALLSHPSPSTSLPSVDHQSNLSSWYRRDAIPHSNSVLENPHARISSTLREANGVEPPRLSSTSLSREVPGSVAASGRSHYRFYVMDAHDFLKGQFLEPPAVRSEEDKNTHISVSEDHSKDSKRMSPPPTFQAPRTTYNIIFLDCYDPDMGTMIHSATLLSRCKERLSPGGVLLINAHVGADHEILQKLFLNEGFVSVQVLKVAGCCQVVVACMVSRNGKKDIRKSNAEMNDTNVTSEVKEDHRENEKLCAEERFTLPVLRRFAEYINEQQLHLSNTFSSIQPLILERDWLTKSSLVSKVSIAGDIRSEASSTSTFSSFCGCRVWEHRT